MQLLCWEADKAAEAVFAAYVQALVAWIGGAVSLDHAQSRLRAQPAGQLVRFDPREKAEMTALPDPVWPVIVLALMQFGDGILCIRPVGFVRKCFEDVNFPREWWWVTPITKFAAAAGLVAGIWVPVLGALTACALVLYFLVAIFMHARAQDFGRNLFLNATSMLVMCVVVTRYSFVG